MYLNCYRALYRALFILMFLTACTKVSDEIHLSVHHQGSQPIQGEFFVLDTPMAMPFSLEAGEVRDLVLNLSDIRRIIKHKGMSSGNLLLHLEGHPPLEISGYIEPADNYLTTRRIRIEIRDNQPPQLRFVDLR